LSQIIDATLPAPYENPDAIRGIWIEAPKVRNSHSPGQSLGTLQTKRLSLKGPEGRYNLVAANYAALSGLQI